MARHGEAWQGLHSPLLINERQGMAWLGKAGQGMARRGMAGHGWARHGRARRGSRPGTARLG